MKSFMKFDATRKELKFHGTYLKTCHGPLFTIQGTDFLSSRENYSKNVNDCTVNNYSIYPTNNNKSKIPGRFRINVDAKLIKP